MSAGIIRRAAEHILGNVDALKQKLKPGEAISVKAYGLELYNEELRDLSSKAAAAAAAAAGAAGYVDDPVSSSSAVRISERPGGIGRCIPEVRPLGRGFWTTPEHVCVQGLLVLEAHLAGTVEQPVYK
jgi:hypothetical protein